MLSLSYLIFWFFYDLDFNKLTLICNFLIKNMGKSVKFYFSTFSQLIWLWHELLQCIPALRHEHLEVLQFVLHWHLLNPWPPQILWARTISRKVNSLSGACISLSPLYLMDSIWFRAIFPLILPLLVPTTYPYSSVESTTPRSNSLATSFAALD